MIKFGKNLFKLVLESPSIKSYRRISMCKITHINNRTVINDDLLEQVDYDQFSFEKIPRRSNTILKLKELFDCSNDNAENIIKKVPDLAKRSISNINDVVSFCDNKGISHDILFENTWILALKIDDLKTKFEMLDEINPRQYDDFVPFLQLDRKALERLTTIIKSEALEVPEGNRLYFFEKMTKIKAMTAASHFALRWFVYEVPFLYFRHILKFLLDSGVAPKNILKDLWVFKYHPNKVRQRITIAKRANSKTIMPWMVRCKSSIFDRFLSRTKERETVLANRTIEAYLCDKLQCNSDMAKYIVSTNASIKNIHITKIQDTLDYLLEEGYTAFHIAQVPRILCNSLKTTKERMEEVKKLGRNPTTLTVLCKSKKEFVKYIRALERKKLEKLEEDNVSQSEQRS